MDQLLDKYIKANEQAWSPTTIKSEKSRLRRLLPYLDSNPDTLWNAIQDKGSYTRLTTWTRVTDFWGWLITEGYKTGPNPYEKWRNTNSKKFKNVYNKERLEVTYEEAKERISKLDDGSIRKRALEILYSGQRYCESCQEQSEIVIGKGDKPRPDFRPELPGPSYDRSYATFYRALKGIGLKPHTLRKLALTRLVDKGATVYDLMEVAGWSSPQTAASYIQPKETAKLKKLLSE